MAKAKIALRLSDLTPEEKVANGFTTHGLMQTNGTVFPTPNPTLPVYNTALLNVETRMTAISTMEQTLETKRSLLRTDLPNTPKDAKGRQSAVASLGKILFNGNSSNPLPLACLAGASSESRLKTPTAGAPTSNAFAAFIS